MKLNIFLLTVLVTGSECWGNRPVREDVFHRFPLLPPPYLLNPPPRNVPPPIFPNFEPYRHRQSQVHPLFENDNLPYPYAQPFGYFNPRIYTQSLYPVLHRDPFPMLAHLYNPLYIRFQREPESPGDKPETCFEKVPEDESTTTLNRILEPIIWNSAKESVYETLLEKCFKERTSVNPEDSNRQVNLITLIFPKNNWSRPPMTEAVTVQPENMENPTMKTAEMSKVDETLEKMVTESADSQSTPTNSQPTTTEFSSKESMESVTAESTSTPKINNTQKLEAAIKLSSSV